MATKLTLFREAIRLLGERKLDSLTESFEPRRVMDDIYDGGGVRSCLEMGQWKFATRSVRTCPGICSP